MRDRADTKGFRLREAPVGSIGDGERSATHQRFAQEIAVGYEDLKLRGRQDGEGESAHVFAAQPGAEVLTGVPLRG